MKLKSNSLRDILIEMVRNPLGIFAKPEHTSHGMHTSYIKEASQFIEKDWIEKVIEEKVRTSDQ